MHKNSMINIFTCKTAIGSITVLMLMLLLAQE